MNTSAGKGGAVGPAKGGSKVPPNPDAVDLLAARSDLRRLTEREMTLSHQESNACVDSELMLLWWTDYPLARWVPNPLHWQFPAEKRKKSMPPVLLVSRLDGPTPEIAKRLVDDAVEVEETGLTGKVYVDARGMNFDPKNANDKGVRLRRLRRIVPRNGDVVEGGEVRRNAR